MSRYVTNDMAIEDTRHERYVIGSGAAVQFQPDGSLLVSVSTIGKEPDKDGNVTADPNPSQSLAFVEWLMDRINLDDLDGWLKERRERFCSGRHPMDGAL